MANLIFDFDGTLADSLPLIVELMRKHIGKSPPTPQELKHLRQLPILQALRTTGVSLWVMPWVVRNVRQKMYQRMAEVPVFPEIPAVLKQLHADGHYIYVLSSNLEQNVRLFLAEHHLEKYVDGVYHFNLLRKGAGLRRLLRDKQLAKHDACYVGNEPADIEDAQSAGIKAFAVTWSGQDPKLLSRAMPTKMLVDPRELLELFPKEYKETN